MAQALDEFGFGQAGLDKTKLTREGHVIRMGIPPMRLEIQTSISAVDFADCYSRAEMFECFGVAIKVISLEDLKINKKASGRLKDLADLESLQ